MEEPTQTLQAIAQWEQGGSVACLSAAVAYITSYPQAAALDALTQSLQVLVLSLVSSSETRLSVDTVVQFMVSLLAALPSSSAQDPRTTLNAILIDVIWTVDVGLDDSLPSVSSKTELPADVKATYDNDRRLLASLVKALVVQGVLPDSLCRQNLEVGLLGLANLLDDAQAFERRTIRVRTAVNYKQTNYNLLREQSEGFSKLITEVVSSIGPPHDPATGLPTESAQALRVRASKAWDNVVGLIGYFDLNANRVLDVIIDIFAGHALSNYAFFVELLRLTPWALPVKETQYDRRTRGVLPQLVHGQYESMEFDDIIRAAEQGADASDDTQTPRTCVLGQILGFKFAQFQMQDGEQKISPRKLYFATALLVREGLVSIEDVYPHLSPSDEDMERGLAKYRANMKDKMTAAQSSGGPSMGDAAPLRDAGPPSRSSIIPSKTRATDSKPSTTGAAHREPIPQKLNILRTLIGMGALRPAFFILSKFDWVASAYPEVADQFLAMLDVSIAQLLVPASSSSDQLLMAEKNAPSLERTIVEAGKAPSVIPKKRSLVASCPVPKGNHYTEFVYFYPAWLDTLPLCTTRREVFTVIEPFLRFTGIQCYRDIPLLTKLCRIGRADLLELASSSQSSSPIRDQWRNLLRRYLLPALSMTRANAVFNMEVWSLLQTFDSKERWGIYGEWAQAHTKYLELKVRHVEVTRDVRGILRRVTVNGNNKLALPLAKLAHSNPCIVFSECVKQAMAYDNLIEAIAESARSLTPLGYDVLVWSILTAFSNSSKPRMKEDGTSVALWLQSLSTYTAAIYKKFGGQIDQAPILEYVVHRLKIFRSIDLIILRELIATTTNIQPQANLTDDQVICVGGGPALRIESLAPDTRGSGSYAVATSNDLGTRRLLEALNKADLLVPMLVLVAQQREFCVEQVDRSEEHLKHISNLYDECQAALFQYAEFLMVALGPKYPTILPPLDVLCDRMSIKPDVAFHLYRPALRDAVMDEVIHLSDEKTAREKAQREEKERLLKQQLTAKRAASAAAAAEEDKSVTNGDVSVSPSMEDTQTAMVVDQPLQSAEPETEATPSQEAKQIQPWLPQLLPLIESAKKILPAKASRVITPGFYVTFWQMSMLDLSPPALRKVYERETTRIRSLLTSASSTKHRSERHLLIVTQRIMGEQRRSHRMQKATLDRLEGERSHWFRRNAATHPLVQQLALTCLYPRSLLSPTDAEFSARFMKVLHDIGTPGYSTVASYANLFGAHLGEMIFSLSEHQTQNFGRFYRIVLEDLELWSNDEASFRGAKPDSTPALPGFQQRFTVKDTVTYETLFTLAHFKRVCGAWRERLANALLQLLESNTYIGVRNAIIFLSTIATRFPKRTSHGDRLIRVLERLATTEKRPDLQALVKSYTATLRNRQSSWEIDGSREATQKSTASAATDATRPTSVSAASTISNDSKMDQNSVSTTSTVTNSTSFTSVLDSVEKPAIIKRINRDSRSGTESSRPNTPDLVISKSDNGINLPPSGLPPRPKGTNPPPSPRHIDATPRPLDDVVAKRKPDMPPPIAPSSTAIANDLRTQAQGDSSQDTVMSNGSADRRDGSRPRTPTEPGRQPRGRNKSPSSPHSSSRSRPPSPDGRSEGRRRTAVDGKDRTREDDDRQQRGTRIAGAAAERDRKERDSRLSTKDVAKDHDRERDRGRDHRGSDRDRDRDARKDRYPADADKERDRERERERDRGARAGREKDRDGERDRDRAREADRSSRRDSYDALGRRGTEKESSRSSRRDTNRSTDDLLAGSDRDRSRGGPDDNSHKRRRDEEDADSAKRRRANEGGSSYVPSAEKDRDRDREGGSNGRSDRPHERGARRDRNADGSRSTPNVGDTTEKRRDKRDRNEDRAANGNGSSRRDDAPTSPSGRPPPTGPRSERDRGGRDDPPYSLADRLAPPSPSRGESGNDRRGDRARGRDLSPPANNRDGGFTPPMSDSNDSGSRKRSASGEGNRALFDQAVGNVVNSKRVKINRKRQIPAKD